MHKGGSAILAPAVYSEVSDGSPKKCLASPTNEVQTSGIFVR